jgi:hypothetical protein
MGSALTTVRALALKETAAKTAAAKNFAVFM